MLLPEKVVYVSYEVTDDIKRYGLVVWKLSTSIDKCPEGIKVTFLESKLKPSKKECYKKMAKNSNSPDLLLPVDILSLRF